jgi:adenine-specific DNA-methyltransferase
MIKYLGSKRTLIPAIVRAVESVPGARSALDLFSGTARVGHALKASGYRVLANDHNTYAHTLATCYVQADKDIVEEQARRLIAELNRLPGSPGYFTEIFCERSRFFQPKNGARIDAIRGRIEEMSLEHELEAVLLVSLMEAADRVDSTTGLQMAYLKDWAPRSHNDLNLRLPKILPQARNGKGEAHCLEADDAARSLKTDVAYVDPPYNQHSYLGNYHIWETLVRWDKPEVYGVACKRVDCRSRRSVFNSKTTFYEAMAEVIRVVQAPVLIVSFNDEGFMTRTAMESLLRARGSTLVLENDYKRYVGAQIGIHNPQGEKVGSVSHLRNTEYLYIVAPEDTLDEMSAMVRRTETQVVRRC